MLKDFLSGLAGMCAAMLVAAAIGYSGAVLLFGIAFTLRGMLGAWLLAIGAYWVVSKATEFAGAKVQRAGAR